MQGPHEEGDGGIPFNREQLQKVMEAGSCSPEERQQILQEQGAEQGEVHQGFRGRPSREMEGRLQGGDFLRAKCH